MTWLEHICIRWKMLVDQPHINALNCWFDSFVPINRNISAVKFLSNQNQIKLITSSWSFKSSKVNNKHKQIEIITRVSEFYIANLIFRNAFISQQKSASPSNTTLPYTRVFQQKFLKTIYKPLNKRSFMQKKNLTMLA